MVLSPVVGSSRLCFQFATTSLRLNIKTSFLARYHKECIAGGQRWPIHKASWINGIDGHQGCGAKDEQRRVLLSGAQRVQC
jgi:hypothetical protein